MLMSFFSPVNGLSPTVIDPNEGKVLDILGDTVTIKISGEETGGAYAIMQDASPPKGGPPLHVHHREDEAFYVLEGEYEVRFGDRTIKAVPGAWIFAPRDIPHAFRNISAGPGKVLIVITPAGIEAFFEEISELGKAASGPPDPEKAQAIAHKYGIELMFQEET